MLNPWVFGDEYLYLSKARNIAYGIDVVTDASLGHKYPPLYSYLLALVFTRNPDTTYRNVQLLNLVISQLLIAVSWWLLSWGLKQNDNDLSVGKVGRTNIDKERSNTNSSRPTLWLLRLGYLATASLLFFWGYYPVAMSENLFTPLVLLIFVLVYGYGRCGLRNRCSDLMNWLSIFRNRFRFHLKQNQDNNCDNFDSEDLPKTVHKKGSRYEVALQTNSPAQRSRVQRSKNTINRIIVIGVLTSAAILTRSIGVVLIPSLIIWLIAVGRSQQRAFQSHQHDFCSNQQNFQKNHKDRLKLTPTACLRKQFSQLISRLVSSVASKIHLKGVGYPGALLTSVGNFFSRTTTQKKLMGKLRTVLCPAGSKTCWLKQAVILLAAVCTPYLMIKLAESVLVQNPVQATNNLGYSAMLVGYLDNWLELISGQGNLWAAVKILGNHTIYLLIASFFFPILMLINELVVSVRTKKIQPDFVFLIIYSVLTVAVSFTHCYTGFDANPIKYSTYFRYVDSVAVLFFVWGLTRVRQWWQQQRKVGSLSIWLFVLASIGLVLLLPDRDFYLTLNSFGWGWLDLFAQNQGLIKPVLMLMVGSVAIIFSPQKNAAFKIIRIKRLLLLMLLGVIISINLASLPIAWKTHRWLAHGYSQRLDQPLHQILELRGVKNFFASARLIEAGYEGEIYYTKYYLLFYTDNLVPMPIIAADQSQERLRSLLGRGEKFVWLDVAEADVLGDDVFDEVLWIEPGIGIGVGE